MKSLKYVFPALLMAITLCGCVFHYDPSGNTSAESSNRPAETNKEVTDEELLEKAETARIANPWGETQSLSVAEEWAGLSFTPPADEIELEDGSLIKLTVYRYMEGIIEALYSGEDYELVVRKSDTMQGTELAGDYNSYASETEESIEGQTLHCLGDGETINLAYYDTPDGHFSVSFHNGEKGLTVTDLTGIVKSMH